MSRKSIYAMTASEIVESVQKREYSAHEIVDAFVERRKAVEHKVFAWTAIDDEYFYRQADAVDRNEKRGGLAGVPFGIKDVFNTEVLPTQRGSSIWKGYMAGNDARCVSYLRRQGGL